MPALVDARFTSGLDSFSSGTQVTSVGSANIDDAAGALQIGASVTSTRDFAGVTSGLTKVDVWFKYTGSGVDVASSSVLFYVMANGVAPSSGSSIATISIGGESGYGATTAKFALSYRGASGFQSIPGNVALRRGAYWYKLSVIANFSAKTCDYYLDDVLIMRGVAWPNASAANIGRVAVVSQSSSPTTWFDNISVESGWTFPESVLVDHDFVGGSGEIETTTPTTSLRSLLPQPWKIADATYGGFTLGANGAQMDSGVSSFAICRCGYDGVIEEEFKTSVSGTRYAGVLFRFWDHPTATGAGAGVFRFSSTDGNYSLILPDHAGNTAAVASGSYSIAANTIYTLKLEMRGRYYIGSIKAAAMDSGSYTQLFVHAVTSSATGGRGMLSEDYAGPLIADFAATDNYIRRFRFTGAAPATEIDKTIGNLRYQVATGSVRELYVTDSVAPTRNLFLSKGIQAGHRASADLASQVQQQNLYSSANVLAVRQTGSNQCEYLHYGFADVYYTLLRRGPWISDGILPTDTSENFAPDFDLRGDINSTSFYTVGNSGASVSRSDATAHDWTGYVSGATLPAGNQSLTAYPSGVQARISQVVLPDVNAGAAIWDVTSKFEKTGDPISRAISTSGTNLTAGTNYRVARAFLIETGNGATLDGAQLSAFRDDVAGPATLTYATGSVKADAAGDTNADGFNERHGWYEINCSGGLAEFTLPVPSGKRHMPAFRLHGWTNTNTALSINGSPATADVDYVIDEVASGVAVLQLLSTRTANTTLLVGAISSAMPLTGAAAAVAGASGNITFGLSISGAAVGVVTSTGAISSAMPLTGVAAAVAGASGNITFGLSISGAALAAAVASGILGTQ